MQSENMPKGLGPFGTADDIAVQRGIAEFQAGRPVAIADDDETIAALTKTKPIVVGVKNTRRDP